MIKLSWQERVRETEEFHKKHVRTNPHHTIDATANLLHRSHGSIAEDLTLASWLKTHPAIEKQPYMQDALEWIRKRKAELKRGE